MPTPSLLTSPVGLSVEEIQADPWFDDLHDHPQFQALLEGHAPETSR
jgi:hypothetical protein